MKIRIDLSDGMFVSAIGGVPDMKVMRDLLDIGSSLAAALGEDTMEWHGDGINDWEVCVKTLNDHGHIVEEWEQEHRWMQVHNDPEYNWVIYQHVPTAKVIEYAESHGGDVTQIKQWVEMAGRSR